VRSPRETLKNASAGFATVFSDAIFGAYNHLPWRGMM
jgi:hypothetical protein